MAAHAYITIAELLLGMDARAVAQLGSDDGTPLADATLDDDGILTNAINRASGMVVSAVSRGGRYSTSALDDLATADDWTLKHLVVSLAQALLYLRRGADMPEDVKELWRQAMLALERLGSGKWIFDDDNARSSGKIAAKIIDSETRGRLRFVSDGPNFPWRQVEEV